ncbi:serine hydrolase [Bradyrhizobium sp. U531]|uniref:serine hydrolase domain-containing protein n=1 Tax=Bradyrhizobium sp. U531 TaxID=3053458 RepID=UPI003F436720
MNTKTDMGPESPAPLPPGGPGYLTWTPEQQVIGFRSFEKINPVRVVGRGEHVYSLPKAAHQISPRWTSDGQDMDVDLYMQQARTSGLIVLKDGQVLLERYGLDRKEKDRWNLTSASKSVTSILVGAAIQDGCIKSLEALVTDYISELKDSAYEGVTIRQLLTMTSGVQWNESVQGDFTHAGSDFHLFWSTVAEPEVDPMVSVMRRRPRIHEPGAKYNYSTADTHLAGILVSNAVAKSLSEYLSDKLWQPYGMEEDAIWQVDAGGRELGGGWLSVTLRDCARIGQFMLSGGKAGARQVLPPGWVEDATSAHVTFPSEPASDRIGYGYFWWITKNSYVASGGFGQRIIVYPQDKVVIVINSAWPSVYPPGGQAVHVALAEALRAAAIASR